MPPTPWDELSPEHKKYLVEASIPDPERWGVRSILRQDDLPAPFVGYPYGPSVVPGLLFPFSDGADTALQLRPDVPLTFDNGDVGKYLWPKDTPMVLGHWLPVTDATTGVLIVEGTKQSLAAASYAPAGMAVLGMFGCRGWYREGVPNPSLRAVSGRSVYIVLDSDAATNSAVYDAGMALLDAVLSLGASSVQFVRVPGSAKTGLDDVLGSLDPSERGTYLLRLIDLAKTKPADRKPLAKKSQVSSAGQTISGTADRPVVIINIDRMEVIDNITAALVARHDGDRLFSYGGVLAERDGAVMTAITKESFPDLLAHTVITISRSGKGEDSYAWPEATTMAAVLSRANAFSPLERIGHTPFLRPDGTVCQKPGYDAETRTFLILSDQMMAVRVAERPSAADVEAARVLLTDDLLGDFPFLTEADRANALGTLLTPFIRQMMHASPLAVIDGKEAGSGKNLYADVIGIVVTGEAAEPLPYSIDDAEQRKVITSAFRSGSSLFVFDEAHTIGGASMARALTGATYSDRVLGQSVMLNFPNNATWLSLGNQVQLQGDMARRSYRVRMEYSGGDPENRPESDFRHPALKRWVREHRAELVAACLTLVRAWFVAGQPRDTTQSFRFGSFEQWQDVVGGILSVAQVPGLLSNVRAWRSENDSHRQYNVEHLRWLHKTFGEESFTTAAAAAKLRSDPHSEMPQGIDALEGKGANRVLGQTYARLTNRVLDGYALRLREQGAHGSVRVWFVETVETSSTDGGIGRERREQTPYLHESSVNDFITDSDVATSRSVKKASTPGHGGGQRGSLRSPPTLRDSLVSVHPMIHKWLSVAQNTWSTTCDRCGEALELAPSPLPFLHACRSCFPATFEERG